MFFSMNFALRVPLAFICLLYTTFCSILICWSNIPRYLFLVACQIFSHLFQSIATAPGSVHFISCSQDQSAVVSRLTSVHLLPITCAIFLPSRVYSHLSCSKRQSGLERASQGVCFRSKVWDFSNFLAFHTQVQRSG